MPHSFASLTGGATTGGIVCGAELPLLGEKSCFSVVGPVNVKLVGLVELPGIPANPPGVGVLAGDGLDGPPEDNEGAGAGKEGLTDDDSEPLDGLGLETDTSLEEDVGNGGLIAFSDSVFEGSPGSLGVLAGSAGGVSGAGGGGSVDATVGDSGVDCSCIFRPITAPHRHRNVQVIAIPILCSSFMPVLLGSDELRQSFRDGAINLAIGHNAEWSAGLFPRSAPRRG